MRLSLKKKTFSQLHLVFFFLLVLLLPLQLGKHFWPSWSLVFGLRVDHLSPTLYLTDLIVFALLFSWQIGECKLRNLKSQLQNKKIIFSFFFIFLNLFFAQSRGLAFYKWLKIAEFFFLGLYVSQIKLQKPLFLRFLSLTLIYSSLIALGQFVHRGSLGGLLYYLGERDFTLSTPGIAKIILLNRLHLRPYATFPHPNALAGFFLVSLVLLLGWTKKKGTLFWLSLILGILTLLLSFSKITWIFAALALAFWPGRGVLKNFPRPLVFLILSTFLIFLFLKIPLDPYSFSRRIELTHSSLLMIQKYPFLGVGLGNFLSQLPFFWQAKEGIRFLQPVHNIFLLLATETGLLGLGIFLWFLSQTVTRLLKTKKYFLLYSLFIIFFTGLFDHYWLTLQQNQLLFTLLLGFAWQNR